MLDIKFIRENQSLVEAGMKNRQASVDVAELIQTDDQRRRLVTEVEELKAEKNRLSKQIGEMMKAGGDAEALKAQVREMGERIASLDEAVREAEGSISQQLLFMPNLPSAETPVGADESDNPVIRSYGEAKQFDFEPKPHWEIGAALALFDLERGAKLSGSGFPLYTGAGAQLERALIQFMLDMHTEQHGYVEVAPPYFCNAATMTGTGQLPKFAEDRYTMPEDGLYAIPTAEVPLPICMPMRFWISHYRSYIQLIHPVSVVRRARLARTREDSSACISSIRLSWSNLLAQRIRR